MTIKTTIGAVALAAAIFVGVGNAAAADLNIGVVNIARLLAEAPQAKSALSKLEDEFAVRQQAIVAEEQQLRTRIEQHQKDSAVMSDDQRRSAEQEMLDTQRSLAKRQQEFLRELDSRKTEELSKLQRSLMEEVQLFARTQDYDLIIGEGVLYANGTVDVTAQVLSNLQSSYNSSQ